MRQIPKLKVIYRTYVVNALKTDPSLDYDIYDLGTLLYRDYPSFRRHEAWYNRRKALHKAVKDLEEVDEDVASVIEGFSAKMRLNTL